MQPASRTERDRCRFPACASGQCRCWSASATALKRSLVPRSRDVAPWAGGWRDAWRAVSSLMSPTGKAVFELSGRRNSQSDECGNDVAHPIPQRRIPTGERLPSADTVDDRAETPGCLGVGPETLVAGMRRQPSLGSSDDKRQMLGLRRDFDQIKDEARYEPARGLDDQTLQDRQERSDPNDTRRWKITRRRRYPIPIVEEERSDSRSHMYFDRGGRIASSRCPVRTLRQPLGKRSANPDSFRLCQAPVPVPEIDIIQASQKMTGRVEEGFIGQRPNRIQHQPIGTFGCQSRQATGDKVEIRNIPVRWFSFDFVVRLQLGAIRYCRPFGVRLGKVSQPRTQFNIEQA